MPETALLRSPLHSLLEARGAHWRIVGETPVAVHFGSVEDERRALDSLALCDLSGRGKLSVQGPGAVEWLQAAGIETPDKLYELLPFATDGWIARLGANAFWLEGGWADDSVAALATQLDAASGQVLGSALQDASLLLLGERAPQVLAQTCGLDLAAAVPQRWLLTRVAGVSCGVLPAARPPQVDDSLPAYRLSVEASYAPYLWETLLEIVESLDGMVVGVECLYGELR